LRAPLPSIVDRSNKKIDPKSHRCAGESKAELKRCQTTLAELDFRKIERKRAPLPMTLSAARLKSERIGGGNCAQQ
jgi:hypothetical protein